MKTANSAFPQEVPPLDWRGMPRTPRPASPEPPPDHAAAPRMRPRQKVRSYIFQQAEAVSPKAWPLPSMRQMAAHLDVSVTTVQSVYHALEEEGHIRNEAPDGLFFDLRHKAPKKSPLFIGLDLSRHVDVKHTWIGELYGRLLEARIQHHERLKLHRFSPEENVLHAIEEARRKDRMDGMIILGGKSSEPVQQLCKSLAIPMVYLLPAEPNATENFICPDLFHAASTLAETLVRSGRRRIAVVEYLLKERNSYNSLYHNLLLSGLIDGLREETRSLDHLHYHSAYEEEEEDTIRRMLSDSKRRPDALIVRDVNATRAIRIAKELKIKVPEELSIIATTGLVWTDPEFSAMSRIQQPFDRISEELLQMVEALIESPFQGLPGKYLPCAFGGGATTSRQENHLLGIH